MQRRDFLQLAISTAAGAVVPQLLALSGHSSGWSLRLKKLSLPPGLHGTLISITDGLLPAGATCVACPPLAEMMTEMIWERRFRSPAGHYQWIVNGQQADESTPLLLRPQSYRLRLMNATTEKHALHLQQPNLQRIRLDLDRYSAVDIALTVPHSSAA